MSNRVLNVSKARRELPRLVKRVAQGGAAVAIGSRGEETAVLVGIEENRALQARAKGGSAEGWEDLRVEIVGTAEDVEQEIRRIRMGSTDNLDRRAHRLEERPARRRRS
jgi:prevent-host-death family protein